MIELVNELNHSSYRMDHRIDTLNIDATPNGSSTRRIYITLLNFSQPTRLANHTNDILLEIRLLTDL